tara:strand:+ start:8802 stop:9269 length:468 start_codon:yes stop_codon:yes gene_type:complete
MSYENSAGLGVTNQYGVRDTQDSAVLSGGKVESQGSVHEAVVYFTGDELGAVEVVTSLSIPAGARVLDATLEVVEAITMGNADNDIVIGTATTSETNGVDFDNTTGAAGAYAGAAANGTWAAPLALATSVAVQVTGTDAGATGGKGKIVVRYLKV